MEEFGLDSSKVTWVVDDEEHVEKLRLPPNVVHTPPGRALADMMAAGEIAAGFAGNAGIGRSGSPTGGWRAVEADYPDLFPNALELESEWYARTGIYPMHGTVVLKESVLKDHPWVGKSIFEAFSAAKERWLRRLEAEAASAASDKKYAKLREIVGPDPLPYGIEPNLRTIEALTATAFRQGLTPERMPLDALFMNPASI
jgi:4,5-dihydroxyphthalate decarboxylase